MRRISAWAAAGVAAAMIGSALPAPAGAETTACSAIMAPMLSFPGMAESLSFSADGRRLAVFAGVRLTVWDLDKAARAPQFDRRRICLLGSADSHLGFIGDDLHPARVLSDGIEIYSPDDKAPPGMARYRMGVELSAINGPAGRAAFFRSADPTLVEARSGPATLTIVDARTGVVRKTLDITPAAPSLVRFSPEGDVIAVAAKDRAALTDVAPQYNHPGAAPAAAAGAQIDVFNLKTGARTRLNTPADHYAALAVSPRGSRVAAISVQQDPGSEGLYILTVWKAPGWKVVQQTPLTPDTLHVLEFADDEHLVAMGNGGFSWITIANGRVDHENPFPGFNQGIAAAVSPDGKTLAVGGNGDRIELIGLPALDRRGELK